MATFEDLMVIKTKNESTKNVINEYLEESAERRESEQTFQQRVKNNYPHIDNNFYELFLNLKIKDFAEIENLIEKMGKTLYDLGVISLWDCTKVNVSYYHLDDDGTNERLMGAYTDYRTNRMNVSGSYIRLSVTTPLNGKQSANIDMHFIYKRDFRYLAFVATKLFMYALDNFCYSETRVAFLNENIGKRLDELVRLIKQH